MRNIWIIDDTPEDLYIAERILRKSGVECEIICFQSSETALKTFSDIVPEDQPQLILLDLLMPVMDGFTFIEELKKIIPCPESFPKIIILTSSSDQGDMSRAAMMENVADYYVKPLTLEMARQLYTLIYSH